MISVATPREMREADRLTIESGVASGLELMERAGRGAADEVRRLLPRKERARVAVVSGKGMNGGDGFVVARHLRDHGAQVRVFVTADGHDAYRGDARTNLDRLLGMGQPVVVLDEREMGDFGAALADADVVVDALLGTGFTGAVRAPLEAVIAAIDASASRVVALDVPSGVDGLTGAVGSVAVRAEATVTFGAPKLGLLLYPGRSHAGRVRTVDIGIPGEILDRAGVNASVLTTADARELLPRRAPDAHKGDCGRVLVAGGSVGLTGAVALSAEAALIAGAGLVTCAVPESLNDILEVKLTEVMTCPCAESGARAFAESAAAGVLETARGMDAMALGPGLSRTPGAAAFAREVALAASLPAVVDADALNAFERRASDLAGAAGPRVLTPHPGEAARLLGEAVAVVRADVLTACRRLAEMTHAVVVLKGAPTVVCDGTREEGATADVSSARSGHAWINPTGNAGLATGGSGDVLTGVIVSLVAQGLAPADAARLGVFVHGAAGDLGADSLTEWGLTASALVTLVPEALGLLDAGEELAAWIR